MLQETCTQETGSRGGDENHTTDCSAWAWTDPGKVELEAPYNWDVLVEGQAVTVPGVRKGQRRKQTEAHVRRQLEKCLQACQSGAGSAGCHQGGGAGGTWPATQAHRWEE